MLNKTLLTFLCISFLLSACEAFLLDQAPPEIQSSNPTDGQTNIAPTAPILITFDETMDRESVERAFTLTRENLGDVAGVFSWSGKTMIFTPSTPLEVDPRYIIKVSQKAEDSAGNNLLADYISTFTVAGRSVAPILISHWPDDGAYIATRTNDILLTFSTNMDLSSIFEAFSISPSAAGMTSLLSNNTVLSFHPTSPLVHGSLYTVTVSKAALDGSGNALKEDITFQFTIGTDFIPPSLVSFSTQNGPNLIAGDSMITNIDKTSTLQLVFSEPMSTTETKSAFSIEPSVSGSVRVEGSNVLFTPTDAFRPETVYTVKIADSAADLQGNTLSDAQRVIFKTDATNSRYLAVTGIYNETNYQWSQNIVVPILSSTLTNLKIGFSAPIDILGVIPYFSIDYFTGSQPTFDGSIGEIQIVSNNTILIFDLNNIGEGNIYKLSIIKDAYDLFNNPMNKDWIFFFQT